ncbi:HDIG domain-containing protein [Couchioplanes caeruleus]|uniref:HD domain-containing protein n=1 Tax=Couchioplanes caeruleus TaxID=56438 RepID=UPI0020BDB8F9|nr:HD domain-containing protein [Couchioplanes caeruleus]UQU61908.1 HDIG domain-containing protein [Couchioplanes caeruleus]
MQPPTDDEIRALHERLAPTREAFEAVHTHCVIVCRIAEQFLPRADVDAALVRAGCLLHDIGVYRLYDKSGTLDHANYIRHGVLGHEVLRDLGLPEVLCRFCSHHTGTGLTRDDIAERGLPIPPGDYLADTGEEELVMYADKFHSKKNPPVFLTAASYRTSVRRFGEDKAARFAGMVHRYGEPDLSTLSAEYGHAIV